MMAERLSSNKTEINETLAKGNAIVKLCESILRIITDSAIYLSPYRDGINGKGEV